MCKINKSLSPYPSRYPSPSQHVVIQVYKLPCDRCDGCDSLFSFYMRIAYYPRDCTNSITMLLKELQGCKVNSAIISSSGLSTPYYHQICFPLSYVKSALPSLRMIMQPKQCILGYFHIYQCVVSGCFLPRLHHSSFQ